MSIVTQLWLLKARPTPALCPHNTLLLSFTSSFHLRSQASYGGHAFLGLILRDARLRQGYDGLSGCGDSPRRRLPDRSTLPHNPARPAWDLHRAELPPAHGAEMRHLVRFLRESFVVKERAAQHVLSASTPSIFRLLQASAMFAANWKSLLLASVEAYILVRFHNFLVARSAQIYFFGAEKRRRLACSARCAPTTYSGGALQIKLR